MSECNHKWTRTTDWLGDPSIPNGTMSWSLWICRKCGDEVTEEPDGWEDPDELNADDERDRRIDDALTGDI